MSTGINIAPSSDLTVGTTAVTSGTDGRVFFQAGGVVQQSANLFWDNSNNALGLGVSPLSTSRLDIRAKDGLSTSQSLRIQSSTGGATQFEVTGDGRVGVGGVINTTFTLNVTGTSRFTDDILLNKSNGRIDIQGGGTQGGFLAAGILRLSGQGGGTATNYTSIILVNRGDITAGNTTATSGTINIAQVGSGGLGNQVAPTSGNLTYNTLVVAPGFNTTGTYSGIGRGIYYNPTLTSITGLTHRAIETTTGDVIFGSTSGNVGIGSSSPGARLDVRAQGALSTDIAFRVRNSADSADIFSVRGNGDMYIPAAPFNNQNVIYFAGTTDSIIRYSPTSIGSVAFGQAASITNATYYNTAIGNSATTGASAGFGIAIGFNTLVNSTGGIAIGDRARTSGADTIVIGNTGGSTTYSGSRSIYLGKKGNSGNNFSSDDVFMTHFNSDLSSTLTRANGSLGLLGQQAYIFQNGTGTYGVETFMGNGGNTLVIANHPNVPSTNIANAGQIYVEGGALKYRGSSGTVTVIAPA